MPMYKVSCFRCGTVFDAKAKAFICPACRKRKASESAKRIKLSELGHEANRQKIARMRNGT